MSHLVFFEKPGCGGNARQRAALQAAGHTLERRNLLTAHWTPEALLAFLAPLPVPDWFNRAAPRIKSGELVPEALQAEAALALLLAEPLLIRRPLMWNPADDSRMVGFDTAAVTDWIGLEPSAQRPSSLEGCSSPTKSCSTPTGGQHAPV
ncbi:MAG: ArsC/Spx/MgsR family protein [Hydrogenophaga sp.]|uniref:ArsC/Spx/MgsR family protein n=1 Tax=Hydrogenophaga sp. TaxID=1904254 RepID=UPI00271DFD59|nr:ArsC/Spx/MgsR family protein [Hydrogenophaga sp.]MDO9480723.1 ArsC/Spx/MgsR family protein [Hydrogenophaga sp.]MDP3344564.1 ArsC/Spx/MgsR family protein [Hydrogenophaga sp.]MDP3806550.1 ArsC/Spx/MgsR family protein [Hydrogenophaga sp.]MDZ4239900.1 ArsC/Spx/MgsR family protein [Hydrogenophaga sp.]